MHTPSSTALARLVLPFAAAAALCLAPIAASQAKPKTPIGPPNCACQCSVETGNYRPVKLLKFRDANCAVAEGKKCQFTADNGKDVTGIMSLCDKNPDLKKGAAGALTAPVNGQTEPAPNTHGGTVGSIGAFERAAIFRN